MASYLFILVNIFTEVLCLNMTNCNIPGLCKSSSYIILIFLKLKKCTLVIQLLYMHRVCLWNCASQFFGRDMCFKNTIMMVYTLPVYMYIYLVWCGLNLNYSNDIIGPVLLLIESFLVLLPVNQMKVHTVKLIFLDFCKREEKKCVQHKKVISCLSKAYSSSKIKKKEKLLQKMVLFKEWEHQLWRFIHLYVWLQTCYLYLMYLPLKVLETNYELLSDNNKTSTYVYIFSKLCLINQP